MQKNISQISIDNISTIWLFIIALCCLLSTEECRFQTVIGILKTAYLHTSLFSFVQMQKTEQGFRGQSYVISS